MPEHDQPLGRRPARVAGRERDQALGGPASGWPGTGSITQVSVGCTILARSIAVDVPVRPGLDDHRVALADLVQVGERLAVRGPVPGDGEVADLAGQHGAWGSGRCPAPGRPAPRPDHRHRVAPAEARDVHEREALAEVGRAGPLLAGLAGRGRALPVVADLVADAVLRAIGLEVGPHQLVGDEEQQHEPGGDEQLADAARRGRGRRSRRPARAGGRATRRSPAAVRRPARSVP